MRPVHLLSSALLIFAGCGRDQPAPAKKAPVANAPAAPSGWSDDRIAQWTSGCAHTEPFLADTSDPIPILVSKLVAGELDPQREAREELMQYGAAAVPELRRLFEADFQEPFLSQRVQNIIEVL